MALKGLNPPRPCASRRVDPQHSSLRSQIPPSSSKRGGIYASPYPSVACFRLLVCPSGRHRPPLFLLHVLANIQYLRFGPTLEISKIFNVCSTYKLKRTFSKSRFLHVSKTHSKNTDFHKSKILKNQQGFTLKSSSRVPQIHLQNLDLGHQQNTIFENATKRNC